MPQNFPFFAAPYQKPCLVQALVLMFKGHPNYVSNMFSMKICENNLIGSSSRLNQQAPNTSFKHKSFSFACHLWSTLPSHVREDCDLKNSLTSSKNLTWARTNATANSALVSLPSW